MRLCRGCIWPYQFATRPVNALRQALEAFLTPSVSLNHRCHLLQSVLAIFHLWRLRCCDAQNAIQGPSTPVHRPHGGWHDVARATASDTSGRLTHALLRRLRKRPAFRRAFFLP
jgi:hypothetical protein